MQCSTEGVYTDLPTAGLGGAQPDGDLVITAFRGTRGDGKDWCALQ